jgi:hypothetical protein
MYEFFPQINPNAKILMTASAIKTTPKICETMPSPLFHGAGYGQCLLLF